MTVGKRIKDRRKNLRMSVDKLATKLNKNRATIYRYQKGDIENLSINILKSLAEALDTTPQYLIGWDKKLSGMHMKDGDKESIYFALNERMLDTQKYGTIRLGLMLLQMKSLKSYQSMGSS